MIRRPMVRGIAVLVLVLGAVLAASSPASATTTSLVLPQGQAFAVLGYSCGGIQETAYATGFDPSSGYPTGAAYLSTRCGGSGRGGGYHVTTYTAWASVTWDLNGNVVAYGRLAVAPAVDPGFSAFDAYGNEVYNQSGHAYLVLAPGFVPVPRVTSIAPPTGPASGGTKVTISGAGLTGATGVRFGSVAAAFTVNSDTSITATAPASAAGTVDVTVSNAGGSSAVVAGDAFAFVAAPTVSGISPRSGPLHGGTEVTITGTNLTTASRVDFGGQSAGFEVDSDSQITAWSPAGEAAGTVSVRVTTVGGRSASSSAARFTYVATPPTVTSVDPSSGSPDGGTYVTITGTNLSGAVEVDFGGVPAEFGVNDDTSLVAISPPGTGTVDVTVTGADGTSRTSAADLFTYAAVQPTVAAVTPNAGPSAGGTFVEIDGAGFTTTTEVDFGGVPAEFAVASDGVLYALSPGGAAGMVDVTVTSADGTSAPVAEDAFTYVDPPAVSGIDPAGGPVDGGTEVTISGTNLAGAVEVDFGGTAADFTVNDDGTITAVSPPGDAGTVDVTVTTAGGTSAVDTPDEFTYG